MDFVLTLLLTLLVLAPKLDAYGDYDDSDDEVGADGTPTDEEEIDSQKILDAATEAVLEKAETMGDFEAVKREVDMVVNVAAPTGSVKQRAREAENGAEAAVDAEAAAKADEKTATPIAGTCSADKSKKCSIDGESEEAEAEKRPADDPHDRAVDADSILKDKYSGDIDMGKLMSAIRKAEEEQKKKNNNVVETVGNHEDSEKVWSNHGDEYVVRKSNPSKPNKSDVEKALDLLGSKEEKATEPEPANRIVDSKADEANVYDALNETQQTNEQRFSQEISKLSRTLETLKRLRLDARRSAFDLSRSRRVSKTLKTELAKRRAAVRDADYEKKKAERKARRAREEREQAETKMKAHVKFLEAQIAGCLRAQDATRALRAEEEKKLKKTEDENKKIRDLLKAFQTEVEKNESEGQRKRDEMARQHRREIESLMLKIIEGQSKLEKAENQIKNSKALKEALRAERLRVQDLESERRKLHERLKRLETAFVDDSINNDKGASPSDARHVDVLTESNEELEMRNEDLEELNVHMKRSIYQLKRDLELLTNRSSGMETELKELLRQRTHLLEAIVATFIVFTGIMMVTFCCCRGGGRKQLEARGDTRNETRIETQSERCDPDVKYSDMQMKETVTKKTKSKQRKV